MFEQVNEGGDKVRRTDFKSIPTIALLSPEVRKEIKERTVYVVIMYVHVYM